MGLTHFYTDSNGGKVENPKFLRKTEKSLKRLQKRVSRKFVKPKKKGDSQSNNYKKARAFLARKHLKVSRQRKDFAVKLARCVIQSNDLVAYEDLQVARVGGGIIPPPNSHQKAGLSRSILDVGMREFLSTLEYKLAESGGFLIKAPTRKLKPSQTCPNCGHQRQKDLSERTHHCEQCHFQTGRDIAAAMICFNYALGLGTNLNTCGVQTSTSTATGGWAQVWAKKRETLSSPLGKAE